MHPLLAEVCRARELTPAFLARLQHALKTDIQPKLDELETLRERVKTLETKRAAPRQTAAVAE